MFVFVLGRDAPRYRSTCLLLSSHGSGSANARGPRTGRGGARRSITSTVESLLYGQTRLASTLKHKLLMIMMGNNNNLAAGSAEPDQVEASHSLDDSENSQALHNNDMFFDADLDRLFDDDEVAGGADGSSGVEYDSGILVVEEHQQEETQSEIRQQKEQSQPDQPISNAEGIPSTITTQSSTTNVLVKPKLKRRNSNLEGENRGLPPPGWHSEAADRHHRQEMILEMFVPFRCYDCSYLWNFGKSETSCSRRMLSVVFLLFSERAYSKLAKR